MEGDVVQGGARGQDVVSVMVAGLLMALVVPVRVSPLRLLVWVGLLAYG